ncbi:unnamed protein product, partial [Symbiodinium sp. CCMP2456]
ETELQDSQKKREAETLKVIEKKSRLAKECHKALAACIDVIVLSEFCAPLVCRVPFGATVEDVKAGAMVANDEAAVDTRHLLYDRLQASIQGRRMGTSAG